MFFSAFYSQYSVVYVDSSGKYDLLFLTVASIITKNKRVLSGILNVYSKTNSTWEREVLL